MIDTTLKVVAVVSLALIAFAVFSMDLPSANVGGARDATTSITNPWTFGELVSFVKDVTIGGGTLTLTTANTATSSAIVGCVQTYATSTATPVRLELSTTTALATYTGGPIPTGVVAWRYGTCPNL